MKAKQITGFLFGAILLITGAFSSEAMAADYKAGMNRVEFKSQGEKIVGTLFLPGNYKKGDRLAAIIVDGPWTQVKEQVGYVYGRKLAASGFAALAFDHRFWGESGGSPRFLESPRAKVEDLRNAVSFLETVPAIDKTRIGGLGVCFGASYIVMLAAEDERLKSVATTAAWLHDPESLKKLYGGDRYNQYLRDGQTALENFERNKKVNYVPAFSTTDKHAAMFTPDTANGMDYYASRKRGVIQEWKNQFAQMAWVDWLSLDSVEAVSPRVKIPVLMVHSDNSALPGNVKRFYARISAPKELYWTVGNHLDFYDREKEVNDASSAVTKHFQRTLTNGNQAGASNSNAEAQRQKNRRVVEDFFARLEAFDINGFVNLFDENGVQIMPYSPAGFPKELRGRAAIVKQYGGLPQNFTSMKFTNRVWHETTDPEKFIVEYRGVIGVKATGKPYNNDYIGVFELRGGKIIRYVEYFNPLILQESFGEGLQKNFNVNKEK